MPRKTLKYGLSTDKQVAFVEEYVVDLNATQAAIRAGYSPKTAGAAGGRLLENVKIQAAIQSIKDKRSKRTEITADRVLEEIARIAMSDITDVVEWAGQRISLLDSKDLPKDVTAAIKEVSETRSKQGITTTVKQHDKMRALSMLCKHLGIGEERIIAEITGKDGGPIETQSNVGMGPDAIEICERILGAKLPRNDTDQ